MREWDRGWKGVQSRIQTERQGKLRRRSSGRRKVCSR